MAKNTGTGTRLGGPRHRGGPARDCPICQDPATQPPFAEVKHQGGSFGGAQDERPWSHRHPHVVNAVVAVLIFVGIFVVAVVL
jgi:hypothetical protein